MNLIFLKMRITNTDCIDNGLYWIVSRLLIVQLLVKKNKRFLSKYIKSLLKGGQTTDASRCNATRRYRTLGKG